AHLRGRERSAEADHRARNAEGLLIQKPMNARSGRRTAHIDTFARDNLPPRDQWPELIFDIPAVRYGHRLNCVVELLDNTVAAGHGERAAIRSPTGVLTHGPLLRLGKCLSR